MSNRPFTNKIARAVCDAVTAAGGTVEITKKGHLKVTGPGGIAIVGYRYQGGNRRIVRQITAHIRQHAGLTVVIRG